MSGALITLDKSAAFDVIPHELLEKKMKHIGFNEHSLKLMMSYLRNRKQFIKLNGKESDILLTGENSVSQGSVLSGLLYLIFTLDMHYRTHPMKHSNHSEYSKCKNIYMNTFVDDVYSIIESTDKEIWNKVEKYIRIMNQYYIDNRLQINVTKTNVMIITNSKETRDKEINIDNIIIKHKNKITI